MMRKISIVIPRLGRSIVDTYSTWGKGTERCWIYSKIIMIRGTYQQVPHVRSGLNINIMFSIEKHVPKQPCTCWIVNRQIHLQISKGNYDLMCPQQKRLATCLSAPVYRHLKAIQGKEFRQKYHNAIGYYTSSCHVQSLLSGTKIGRGAFANQM